MSWQRIKSLDSLAQPFVKFVDKCYPDAFLFVIILTFITFFLSLSFTDSSSIEIINAWGNGLPKLFTFTAQICIIMITAHALAHTDPIERLLNKVGSLPTSANQSYALVAFVSGVASLFAWSFGLIVGGLIAKFVAFVNDAVPATDKFPDKVKSTPVAPADKLAAAAAFVASVALATAPSTFAPAT